MHFTWIIVASILHVIRLNLVFPVYQIKSQIETIRMFE